MGVGDSEKSCPSSAWSCGPVPSSLTCYDVFCLFMQILENMNMGKEGTSKTSPLPAGIGSF